MAAHHADGRNVNFEKLVTVLFLSASFFLGFPCRRRKDNSVREHHPLTLSRFTHTRTTYTKPLLQTPYLERADWAILGSRASSEKSRLL